MKIVHLNLLVLIIGIATSCDQTDVRFNKTVNFLDNIDPGVSVPEGDLIRGFRIFETSDTTDERRMYGLPAFSFQFPASGAEIGLCGEGDPVLIGTGILVRIASLIADTGGEDISDDNDCSCDTHIDYLDFLRIQVYYQSGLVLDIPQGTKIHGKILFCPNIPEGNLVGGDRDFSGSGRLTLRAVLRVSDDSRDLLLEVDYNLREI